MIPENLQKTANKIFEIIKKSQNILIIAHIRPDGDAIGSVAGLYQALKTLNAKQIETALLDGVPERFSFAWPKDVTPIQEKEINSNHDLILILDSGDEERIGFKINRDISKTCVVNIDHHASNTNFGDINYVDSTACSTCEIVTQLVDYFGIAISENIATSLMMGLITDSRCFQNEGIRPESYEAAAILARSGAKTAPIFNMFNNNRTETDLRLQGFALNNFRLACNNKLGMLVIKQSDLKKINANVGNIYASGAFNIMVSMKDTFASVVTFEREDGTSSCEFRSRGGINVKDVAVSLGGGGHLAASGCSQQIPVEELAEKAENLMKNQVETYFKSNLP